MASGKSLKEQLLAIFAKKHGQVQEVNKRTGAPVGPPIDVPPASQPSPPVRSDESRSAKKRTVNLAALRSRLRGRSQSAPEAEVSQPARGKREDHQANVASKAVVPEVKPAVTTATRPEPWQAVREPVLLVDTFGAAASRGVIEGRGGIARPTGKAGSASVFRKLQARPLVQVGLDFGTSSTKAMWVRLGVPGSEVRAIDFGHGIAGMPSYCLPSLAAFDSRGRLALGDTALRMLPDDGVRFALSRFKMLVAGGADPRYLDVRNRELFDEHVRRATGDERNCTPEMLTAVFLAFAMRRVRRQLEFALGQDELDLSFNTCVPVDQRANNAVFERFERVIGAAERIELKVRDDESASAWLLQAGDALAAGALPLDQRRLFLVPEAVAGTAAYVSSLRRDSGLHALIDIGAGTTDVSIFNLSLTQREGATSYWYSARSVPYGAGHIEARIGHLLKENSRGASLAAVRAVLAGERDVAPEAGAILHEELDNIRRRTNDAWVEAYAHNKVQSAWTGEKVKVFLAGGGALIPEARHVFSESWTGKWGPYPCATLPDPDNYNPEKVGGPFVRVSVAYGLTIPTPELGDWTMPADSPNHTPPPAPRRRWEQDGDQLIPRAGW